MDGGFRDETPNRTAAEKDVEKSHEDWQVGGGDPSSIRDGQTSARQAHPPARTKKVGFLFELKLEYFAARH